MNTVQQAVSDMPIAGIQAMTTIDFPGKIASVFFTRGCPWLCRYCHNPELRNGDPKDIIPFAEIEDFLRKRADFLEGIVISGGEPTLHSSLPDFLQWIRDFGYSTCLHTNGCSPRILTRILKKKLVDYIAMDVKAPPAAYDRVTGMGNTGIEAARSIELILSSGIEYEFRTTYHPDILSVEELLDIIHAVYSAGARRYFLQRFKSQGVKDRELVKRGEISFFPENVVKEAERLFDVFEVR